MNERFGLTDAQRDAVRRIIQSEGKGLDRVAVFGSRATGLYRANSDLDLVLYGNVDEKMCDHLWTMFQESALPFSVDVKGYNASQAPLRAHIDTVAQTLFTRTDQGLLEPTSNSEF